MEKGKEPVTKKGDYLSCWKVSVNSILYIQRRHWRTVQTIGIKNTATSTSRFKPVTARLYHEEWRKLLTKNTVCPTNEIPKTHSPESVVPQFLEGKHPIFFWTHHSGRQLDQDFMNIGWKVSTDSILHLRMPMKNCPNRQYQKTSRHLLAGKVKNITDWHKGYNLWNHSFVFSDCIIHAYLVIGILLLGLCLHCILCLVPSFAMFRSCLLDL